jgi:hypothetical protein
MVDAFAHALSQWTDDEITSLATGLDRLREDFAATRTITEEAAR